MTDKQGEIIGAIELFVDISNQTANELRVKELEKLALLDTLTQLANRNFIESKMKSILEEKRRLNVSFGVLFMDIDHFKTFNDTYGHHVGDTVLKSVARTFVANTRPFDHYGRWGGEEFIGVIRNVDENGLNAVGNRIRSLVQNTTINHDNQPLSITISVYTTLVEPNDTMDSIIKRVDALLYKSKKKR